MSNKVARYFKKIGYKKGDTVALLMESRPEYVCFWLGLSKIGVITALINNNLVRKPLTHSISIAHTKAIILGSDYVEGNLFKKMCLLFFCPKIVYTLYVQHEHRTENLI